jgi:hypothetical protein
LKPQHQHQQLKLLQLLLLTLLLRPLPTLLLLLRLPLRPLPTLLRLLRLLHRLLSNLAPCTKESRPSGRLFYWANAQANLPRRALRPAMLTVLKYGYASWPPITVARHGFAGRRKHLLHTQNKKADPVFTGPAFFMMCDSF